MSSESVTLYFKIYVESSDGKCETAHTSRYSICKFTEEGVSRVNNTFVTLSSLEFLIINGIIYKCPDQYLETTDTEIADTVDDDKEQRILHWEEE